MPRVGSSMISTSTSAASHLPSTTFCWLPPLRAAHRLLEARRLDAQVARPSARPARPRVARVHHAEARQPAARWAARGCACTVSPSTRPCALRSSGSRPMPRAIASAGARERSVAGPSPRPARRPARSAPTIARASSVRPAPSSPATPRISPRRSVKLTSRSTPPRGERPRRAAAPRPAARAASGKCSLSSRSAISRTSSSMRHLRRPRASPRGGRRAAR